MKTNRRKFLLVALVMALALIPRWAIALQPIPVQLDKTLPDDSYYYFLTAQNILAGDGPSVDGMNNSNGWHPLWLIINLGLFSIPTTDPDLPVRLALMVGGLFDALVVVVLYASIRHYVSQSAALVGAGFYALNSMPMFQAINGLETGLAALLTALAWWISLQLVEKPSWRRAVAWGGIFGLCFLARTDTALIMLPLGLYVLLALPSYQRIQYSALGAVIALVVITPWLLWNQVNFGSAFTQVSSVAVPWAVRTRFETANPGAPLLQLSLDVLADTTYWIRGDYLGAPLALGFILWPLALWGLYRGWQIPAMRRLAIIGLTLVIGGATLVLVHTTVRWYPRPWYFVVMAQALSLGLALLWARMDAPRVRAALTTLVAAGMVLIGVFTWQIGLYPWQTDHIYRASLWLRENSPPGVIVGSMNSGIIGYYSERTTINLDGVVNPNAFAASQERELMAYMQESEIDYFLDFDHAVENEYGLFMGPNFRTQLDEITRIGESYAGLGYYRIYTLASDNS